MKKSIFFRIKTWLKFSLLTVAGLFIFVSIFPQFSQAASLSDLYQKKNQVSNTITQSQKAADEKKAQAAKIASDLKKVNQDIADTQAKINETQDQINQAEKDLENTQNEINKKENELKEQVANRNEALRVIYENSGKDNFEIVLGANTLSEVVNYNEYIDALEQKIESTIIEITQIRNDLENKKNDLIIKKGKLDEMKSQQQAYKDGLAQTQNQKNSLLSDTKAQQKSYEQEVAEAQKLDKQIQAEISSMLAAQNSSGRTIIARDRGTSSVGLQWPMDYRTISAYFGEPMPYQLYHTGIDLTNIAGTPVYSSADGTVTFAALYGGYGNFIIIGHNARFATAYAHLSAFNVAAGQEVKRGQLIGYSGGIPGAPGAGNTTGPHLHFEVREYGNPVNPLNYLP
ncbi:MAG: peptidoglycan DD-metalloendopeptidase family protein [Patescibacteria group bacterium]|nr:peptidoglycan DD-metalloendopeptidase family protein [Patescibacteria group bacterium]